jgi:uncharacterized protein YbjT (DUF2867 family)
MEEASVSDEKRVLVTGGTGYVGGRLIPLLAERYDSLRLMARRPEYLRSRVDARHDVVQGDVTDRASLDNALRDVHTAYYLIHSMGGSGSFEDQDRDAARNFAEAAKQAGVKRIIYLGGLGVEDEELSAHLRSRHEVGRVLRESGAEVIEFRASIVIGSGSLSFELIRALVRKLPIMICPKWVSVPAQPIAIEDILAYLVGALDLEVGASRVFEIGGPDQVSYGDLMQEYARQRGMKRWMIKVPLLTPRLSSLWLGLVTPVYARIGRKLVESLRNPTVVKDQSALSAFPIKPMSLSSAIERALANEDKKFAETRWDRAVSSSGATKSYGGQKFGSRLVDSRTKFVELPPAQAFAPIQRIGGETGWYYGQFLWRIRGWMDRLVGGIGLRRGRHHPVELKAGDPLDFWRVEEIKPARVLRLFAEMRLPGRAWLEFEVTPRGTGSQITQTAVFDPVGLLGLAYWYSISPLHHFVFEGMLNGITRAATDGRFRDDLQAPASGEQNRNDMNNG